jgi:hypothetical protein
MKHRRSFGFGAWDLMMGHFKNVQSSITKFQIQTIVTLALTGVAHAIPCDYSTVNNAVTAASPGATLTCDPGTWTWPSTLSINKGLTLQGAGIGQTTIIFTAGTGITYTPADPNANALIRITGFTFDQNGQHSVGLSIGSGNTTVQQTKLRVDHNRFQNIALGSTQDHFIVFGDMFGVIDNNVFGTVYYPFRAPTSEIRGSGLSEWNKFEGVVFGQADNNLWFENNVFENLTDPAGSGLIVMDCQEGGRYAWRYNTFTIDSRSAAWPMFDMHGNWGQQYSCMGGELYGNKVSGSAGGYFLDQRGGRVFSFNNQLPSSGMNNHIREEQDDSGTPVGTYVGPNPPQYPQHVNGSYYWNNRHGATGSLQTADTNCGQTSTCIYSGDIPKLGRDLFLDSSSPGVSCGTLASRPATCSNGQGYWATNQSCTDLTGMVGAHPATPISGTLYRCTASGWDSGKTPLPYPHPLADSSSNPPPPRGPHPADDKNTDGTSTPDYKMSINEATGYSACWRALPTPPSSCPANSSLDYAVRAGTLYLGDRNGAYHFDSNQTSCPSCWQTGP